MQFQPWYNEQDPGHLNFRHLKMVDPKYKCPEAYVDASIFPNIQMPKLTDGQLSNSQISHNLRTVEASCKELKKAAPNIEHTPF